MIDLLLRHSLPHSCCISCCLYLLNEFIIIYSVPLVAIIIYDTQWLNKGFTFVFSSKKDLYLAERLSSIPDLLYYTIQGSHIIAFRHICKHFIFTYVFVHFLERLSLEELIVVIWITILSNINVETEWIKEKINLLVHHVASFKHF